MRRREVDEELLDASLLPWDEVGGGAVATDTTKAEVQRQQIIHYFLEGGAPECLSDTEWQASPEQEAVVREKLAAGELTEADEVELLLAVRDPLNNPRIGARRIFQAIMSDARQQQILAVMAGFTEANWQEMDVAALEQFLTKAQPGRGDFRTPVGFEKAKRRFMERIRPRASERTWEAYERSMESLEKVLYGRRLDYYQRFEELKREAAQPAEVAAEAKAAAPEVTRLTSERAEAILARTVMEGDPWQQSGREYKLGTYHLIQAGLQPAYEVKISGLTMSFSVPFKLANGRLAVLGYYAAGKTVMKVGSYYRAQPQGLWRYVPDYVRDASKASGIACLGQGYNEVSLNLPVELQEALAEIEARAGAKQLAETNPNFFLVGTAKAYETVQDYREALANGGLRGDYYDEVAAKPFNHETQTTGHAAPQTLAISRAKMPDFERKMAEFQTHVSLVGAVRAEGFWSQDGQLIWLFFRDEAGRAWVGQVEVRSRLATMGLRRDWVVMGDFTTPLYDYSRQTGGYGDPSDVKGPRQCMWRNYLSKVPLIRAYIEAKRLG